MAARLNSCPAPARAFSRCLAPRYWLITTAPPVASAANRLMINPLIMSTSETPEIAASPAWLTIMVSAIPTVTAKNCSMTSGTSRRLSSLRVKSAPFVASILSFPPPAPRPGPTPGCGPAFFFRGLSQTPCTLYGPIVDLCPAFCKYGPRSPCARRLPGCAPAHRMAHRTLERRGFPP